MGRTIADIASELMQSYGIEKGQRGNVYQKVKRAVEKAPEHEDWRASSPGREKWDIPYDQAKKLLESDELLRYASSICSSRKPLKQLEIRRSRAQYEKDLEDRQAFMEMCSDIQVEPLTPDPYADQTLEADKDEQERFYLTQLLEGLVTYIGKDKSEFNFSGYRRDCERLQYLQNLEDFKFSTVGGGDGLEPDEKEELDNLEDKLKHIEAYYRATPGA